jgi:hypothetical protein
MMTVQTLPRTEPITVDVSDYVRAHGRAPRRNQYGLWLFAIDGAEIERTGEYLQVKRQLASEGVGGVYALLP